MGLLVQRAPSIRRQWVAVTLGSSSRQVAAAKKLSGRRKNSVRGLRTPGASRTASEAHGRKMLAGASGSSE
jgi:hypothetical protein